MARTTQQPSRPLTRSMSLNNSIRRSARLVSSREIRPSSSPSSSLFRAPARYKSKKRKKPSIRLHNPPNARSRKECGGMHAPVDHTSHRVDSRESVVGSSARAAKIPVCNSPSSKLEELEKQLDLALQAKQELAAQVDEHKISVAQSTLKHLEEYFTCPLCFDILACPYALTPRNCGHTFCATCILKWFFSRMHKGCGGWHEAVDCPLCRSALPHTPDRIPRSTSSFPFTPNRTANVAIRGLMDTIVCELDIASTISSGSLSEWDEDGHSRQEWSKRERAGRTEMMSIASQWTTLKPTDFVDIKNRLEV